MHRTLLLCFIHGFKGGDNTFSTFPDDLRALISHALPNVSVRAVTYPKFETRGDLKECVGRFREWLQNKVIDLEVSASTPSPTVDPSVHTILVGHSMGGIVAAEALLAITSDSPIPAKSTSKPSTDSTDPLPSTAAHSNPATSPHTFMFPYITGILAFDTPYLGISPGVIAHGAETHYKTASTAYNAFSEVAGVFGYGSASKSPPQKQNFPNGGPGSDKLLTQGADAMTASMTASSQDAAATPTWQRWGKYAMFAGAAGAVAAGGAAAYLKRDSISEGWSWMGSHLEFVGCLARGEELKSRLERVVGLNQERDIGFADLVTVLGNGAVSRQEDKKPATTTYAGGFVEVGSPPEEVDAGRRTFCTVPKSEENRRFFKYASNHIAKDETEAHMTMFERGRNSGYFALTEKAKGLVVRWVEEGEWYRSSDPRGDERESLGLMDVDLNDNDGGEKGDDKSWAGEEPVFIEKGG